MDIAKGLAPPALLLGGILTENGNPRIINRMVNKNLNDVFGSLSDPTRRDMLQRLLGGEMSVNQLAQAYDMSLPAVSKHVKVLEAAGLVTRERRGRQHFVRFSAKNFRDATDHLLYYESTLQKRLDSLDEYIRTGRTRVQTILSQKTPEQTITVSHVFDAPRERLWEAYVNTDEIMHWWGGSTRRLRSSYNDVRVGGMWRFTIAGSEGKDYVMSGMYREVEPGHRLVYTDGMGEADDTRPQALVTVLFEDMPDGKTKLTKTSVATRAVHQLQAAWMKAIEGDANAGINASK